MKRLALALALGATACATAPAPEPEREDSAGEALPESFPGEVVWTSARSGRRHLYRMTARGTTQLTSGDRDDLYPRLSPGGDRILFSRARTPGLSEYELPHDDNDRFRDEKKHEKIRRASLDWDVYGLRANRTSPELLVERGLWASWVDDHEIVFVRDTKILRRDLVTGEETTVLDGDRDPAFENVIFRQPVLSRDGRRLGLELAVRRQQVGLWDVPSGTWTAVGPGGQPTWPSDAAFYWVGPNGRGRRSIVRSDGVAAASPVLDLPLPLTFEAFPKVSDDGRWMVFGSAPATAGPTSLVRADFDVYLWRIGDAASRAVRLTRGPATDSWPDLLVTPPP